MRKNHSLPLAILLLSFLAFNLSGCTLIFQKGRRTDVEKISTLKKELTDLERAKRELEDRLRSEIQKGDLTVEDEGDRGLVITFVAEILFDSGKADLREPSKVTLDKVSRVLNTTVKDLNIGIEGHTDDVPIKHSGWKSNWELSTARALSVLHFFDKEKGISPERLSATGYGEYRPLVSNSTPEGRRKNRRVEIVILPKVEKQGR
ncbi:MAG: OmpA family protein [Candidatus Omnitrophica bacterium]|nr:OmpA family protein [Candidatus Omnitrophota bacterium]